jgi:hypothetical protein
MNKKITSRLGRSTSILFLPTLEKAKQRGNLKLAETLTQ